MATFRKIFTDSLRKLGVLPQAATAQTWQMDRALETFNYLLDSWNIKDYLIYTKVREVFPFVSGQQAYLIGPGGDFDTNNRNISYISALVNKTGVDPCCDGPQSQEFEMKQLSLKDWQLVVNKCLDGSWPMYYYLDNAWPLRKVKFWEIPIENTWAVLYSDQQLTEVTDLDEEVILPYGYQYMIVNNIAIAQAVDYGIQPSQSLLANARNSMSVVQRSNETRDYQYADPAYDQGNSAGRFNILTNTFSTGRTS